MKLTIDGMPLGHLVKEVHQESIVDTEHFYLLINETNEDSGPYDATPVSSMKIEELMINSSILDRLSLPTTRAIPIIKAHRNYESGIILGRSEKSDIVVESPEISKRHAEFFHIGKHLLVRDLDSRNGTFVSSKKINGMKKLESQELIFFSGVVCAVISRQDLQMLCSILPNHWVSHETQTRMFIAPLD